MAFATIKQQPQGPLGNVFTCCECRQSCQAPSKAYCMRIGFLCVHLLGFCGKEAKSTCLLVTYNRRMGSTDIRAVQPAQHPEKLMKFCAGPKGQHNTQLRANRSLQGRSNFASSK
eukprot:scaffold274162_cov24-Tisochrysis_lutea.AAC.1